MKSESEKALRPKFEPGETRAAARQALKCSRINDIKE